VTTREVNPLRDTEAGPGTGDGTDGAAPYGMPPPGYRLPPSTAPGRVRLQVADLERSLDFYRDVLGFRTGTRQAGHAELGASATASGPGSDRTVWNYPGALFLSAGGYHHHLGLNSWARGAEPAGEDDAQLLEWELLVPTVEAARGAMASLAAAGFQVAEESGGGVVRDPWGVPLRIRSRRE
jgi:catechol-2,3-dioxygenase